MSRPKNIIRFKTYRNLLRNEMNFWNAVDNECWAATETRPEKLCEYTVPQLAIICKLCVKSVTEAIASLKRKGLLIVDDSKYHSSIRSYKLVPFWRSDPRTDYWGKLKGLKGATYEIDVLTGEKIPWDVKWLKENGFSIGTPHKPKGTESNDMTTDKNESKNASENDFDELSKTEGDNNCDDLPPYPIEEFDGEGVEE